MLPESLDLGLIRRRLQWAANDSGQIPSYEYREYLRLFVRETDRVNGQLEEIRRLIPQLKSSTQDQAVVVQTIWAHLKNIQDGAVPWSSTPD